MTDPKNPTPPNPLPPKPVNPPNTPPLELPHIEPDDLTELNEGINEDFDKNLQE